MNKSNNILERVALWYLAIKQEQRAWQDYERQQEHLFVTTQRWYGKPRRLVWFEGVVAAFWILVLLLSFCVVASWFNPIKPKRPLTFTEADFGDPVATNLATPIPHP